MPENVLVVVFDTARADAFEPYGAPPDASPTVAQLASSGEAVENMFSTACWTLPSHASLFTGLMPRALGLTQAPDGSPQSARPVLEAQRERLLPEVLRRAGYETRGASANLWVSPYSGFSTGFDAFELVSGYSRVEGVERDTVRGRLRWSLEGLLARQDDGAAEVETILRRYIAEHQPGDKPFFWFVNLVEAHSPYLPPKPYNDLGPIQRMLAAGEARRYLTLMEIWRACVTDFLPPPEALERMRHLYARSVRMLDDWLARLLEALDERGMLDDTLVIVTSDHGENFGEGGLLAHAFSLDDRLTRVPFVTSRPGLVSGAAGATSLASLPSLLARRLGLADHPWADSELPHACATAQFDFIDADDPRVETGAEIWNLDDAGRARLTESITTATDGGLKLELRNEREQLFDLSADPLELQPRDPASHPEAGRVDALRAALAHPAVTSVAAAAPEAPAVDPDDVAEIERRMKLLGYL